MRWRADDWRRPPLNGVLGSIEMAETDDRASRLLAAKARQLEHPLLLTILQAFEHDIGPLAIGLKRAQPQQFIEARKFIACGAGGR